MTIQAAREPAALAGGGARGQAGDRRPAAAGGARRARRAGGDAGAARRAARSASSITSAPTSWTPRAPRAAAEVMAKGQFANALPKLLASRAAGRRGRSVARRRCNRYSDPVARSPSNPMFCRGLAGLVATIALWCTGWSDPCRRCRCGARSSRTTCSTLHVAGDRRTAWSRWPVEVDVAATGRHVREVEGLAGRRPALNLDVTASCCSACQADADVGRSYGQTS